MHFFIRPAIHFSDSFLIRSTKSNVRIFSKKKLKLFELNCFFAKPLFEKYFRLN